MRINKYIALNAEFSRRQADALIKGGKVKINNRIAELGDQVKKDDEIFVNNKKISGKEYVCLAYNKPKGVVSSSPHHGQTSIVQILRYSTKVHPVGRLDKDSTGLIILTNDPRLTKAILHWEKEYVVTINRVVKNDFLEKMQAGLVIPVALSDPRTGKERKISYRTKPAKVKKLGPKKFSIILTEGKKRQIRLMCQALGYHVVSLKRVRIGKIKLDNLGEGKYREIKNLP
ncbi:pseudouridine synthase [Patescibacteria group bacterium]|nr:pseudouridine synthase [Patescibacteria group bacterium]